MARSIHIRATSLLLALGFSLGISADAYGLHGCPHHHGTPETQASEAAGPEGERPESPPADLVLVDAGHDGSHTGDDAGPCTCVGSCHGTAATPLPPAPPAAAPGQDPVREIRPATTVVQPRIRTSLYLLPLANAPPTRG